MIKKYFSIFLFLIATSIYAQEVLTFSAYDGTGINITATTSTVNNQITIVFEDVDIIQNFYTQVQNEIYIYGGLDTDAGGFHGAPDFNTLGTQPQLLLIDVDNNSQPNTYSITINLSQHYSGVADATMVYGFNLLFQNQYGGGGNNQCADLYIDLADALKDNTLNINEFTDVTDAFFVNDELIINNFNGTANITIYDLSGRIYSRKKEVLIHPNYRHKIELPKQQLSFI